MFVCDAILDNIWSYLIVINIYNGFINISKAIKLTDSFTVFPLTFQYNK